MHRGPVFRRLNVGWNAEPNAPCPEVVEEDGVIVLRFYLNPWAHDAKEWQKGTLSFLNCRAWRLGPTNDEGWYRGQCRYSKIAPAWGEFYELAGTDHVREQPDDWQATSRPGSGERHFLFYLRDETFECMASEWSFEPDRD